MRIYKPPSCCRISLGTFSHDIKKMMLRVYFPSIHRKVTSPGISQIRFFSKKGATSAKHNTLQTYETTVPAENENSRHVLPLVAKADH